MSERACYVGVMESQRLRRRASAAGAASGARCMEALVAAADASGLWTIQASVFPENAASLALHEAVGFRVVGARERIAQLHGVWRDTMFLERGARRSVTSARAPEPSPFQRRNTRHALCPPNPNEFETLISTGCSRGVFGM